MSKERPILFNGAMVRAILSGAKTQTRRVAKNIPWRDGCNPEFSQAAAFQNAGEFRIAGSEEMTTGFRCPFGQPGERLWVRERAAFYRGGWHYFADGPSEWGPDVSPRTFYCPSIHMPREACRLVLEIVSVRVERLQAISEADAIAEGLERGRAGGWLPGPYDHPEWAFRQLWDQVHGDSAWDSNPWVWVIEFKRVEVA